MESKNRKPMKPGAANIAVTALCFAVISLGACASQPGEEEMDPLVDIPVYITFDGDSCPVKVVPETFDITSAKRIVWQSVNASGEHIDMVYSIYFDPFKGRPLKSNPHGRKKSPPFDKKTPENVYYKYSIVGERCEDKPLDPRFRF